MQFQNQFTSWKKLEKEREYVSLISDKPSTTTKTTDKITNIKAKDQKSNTPLKNNQTAHLKYVTKSDIQGTVCIIADSHGRFLSALIKKLLEAKCGGKFNIDSIIKPGAGALHVTSGIMSKIQQLQENDTVLIIAGTNDIGLGDKYEPNNIKECSETPPHKSIYD